MRAAIRLLTLLLVAYTTISHAEAKQGSCMVDWLHRAGIKQSRSSYLEKNLLVFGAKPEDIGNTVLHFIIGLFKASEKEARLMKSCFAGTSKACRKFSACSVHGGECILSLSKKSYTCKCPLDYTGRRCEIPHPAPLRELRRLEKEVARQKEKVAIQDKRIASIGSTIRKSISTVYTRWGRTTCPRSAQLVYTGYTAGSRYPYKGGPSNTVCLSNKPTFARSSTKHWGGIYSGSIYRLQGENNKPFPTSLQNKLVPCTVCAVKQKSTTLMIPARNICPRGWRMEYRGYLMGDHYTHRHSKAICVDDAPEGLKPTGSGKHLLYKISVEGKTGLPLSFANKRDMTCVVCSM